jgi:hypothetical protein
MPKTERTQHILLPTILVFFIATLLCTGHAEAYPSADAACYVEVTADGIISEYSLEVRINDVRSIVSTHDRNAVESFRSKLKDKQYKEGFTIDERHDGNNLLITVKNIKPITISEMSRESDDWSINLGFTSYDGKVTFQHFYITSICDRLCTYTLKMPGEILDSTANEVNGDTAIWYGHIAFNIEATSKAPGFPFGLLAILFVICAAVSVFFWRRS